MSSFAGYCNWCEKPVMHKTLFGTLHVCLSPEEKAYVLRQRQQRHTGVSDLVKLCPKAGGAVTSNPPNQQHK